MDENLTAEQRAHQRRLLQSMISELETKIAPIKELDKLCKRCDGMFRVGARVETREDTSGTGADERAVVRRRGRAGPVRAPRAAVALPRRGDRRAPRREWPVAEAVTFKRVRRWPGSRRSHRTGSPTARRGTPDGFDYPGDEGRGRCHGTEMPPTRAAPAWSTARGTVGSRVSCSSQRPRAHGPCPAAHRRWGSRRAGTGLNGRDWTPLHHALFYGYHAAARVLSSTARKSTDA